jgi:hypothetical protein
VSSGCCCCFGGGPWLSRCSFEVAASLGSAEGIQYFTSLVARGITGTVDIPHEVLSVGCRGILADLPPRAWRPRSECPASADRMAELFGRRKRPTRSLPPLERLEMLFPERGAVLRRAMEAQDVEDWRNGLYPEETPGATTEGDASPVCAWEAVKGGSHGAIEEVALATAEWLERNYPPPLDRRMIRKLATHYVPQVSSELLSDIQDFAEMLCAVSAWAGGFSSPPPGISPALLGQLCALDIPAVELLSAVCTVR